MKTDNDITGAGDESGPPSGKKLTAAQVAQELNAKSNGTGWTAHDDKNPSVSIAEVTP